MAGDAREIIARVIAEDIHDYDPHEWATPARRAYFLEQADKVIAALAGLLVEPDSETRTEPWREYDIECDEDGFIYAECDYQGPERYRGHYNAIQINRMTLGQVVDAAQAHHRTMHAPAILHTDQHTQE